jgi:glycosyltransferase involved in cell wall biosynthesis
MNKQILLLGPKSNIKHPEVTGGVIVLFENLLSYCNLNKIEYDVIDTNKANYKNKLVAYISIMFELFKRSRKVKYISLHGTANDYLFLAPIVAFISLISNKSYSLRKFAGNFDMLFENYSLLEKKIILFSLRHSSVNFFETKYLVDYFKKYNSKTYWFPNVRKKQEIRVSQDYEKKFVFIGLVCKEKGIDVLCEVFKNLSQDYTIDIYGELSDGYTANYLLKNNLHYKGKLEHNQVMSKLYQYDVLILPSFREGYPGIIIEALSIGMPIITTKLKGIQEMLDKDSSVLCEVGNSEEVRSAIKSIKQNKYAKMSDAAFKQFEKFDSDINNKIFLQKIIKDNEADV